MEYIGKKGFKATDADLKCRGEQFEIGKIYYKEDVKSPKLCSSQGYHYCNNLEDVLSHYSIESFVATGAKPPRYFKIDILGNFTEEPDKCITTAFRITEEIPLEEVIKVKDEMKRRKEEKKMLENMRLDTLKLIQEKYPQVIVGGSVALFLHGVQLDRLKNNKVGDLDLISPYYTLFEGDDNLEVLEDKGHDYSETCDYNECILINSVKCDLKIDNKQKYKFVEFDGFKYKVSLLEDIMEAKWRYAKGGNLKHKDDCMELLKFKK